MNSVPSNQPAVVSSPSGDDEIDLRQVAGALGRHLRLIAKVAGASLLLSGIYAFRSKPVWEGQFQIVLEEQSAGGGQLALAAANPLLANLAGLAGSGSSSLQTEVRILESPSVLKPVYDYVLRQKRKGGINVDSFRFADWLPSLKVELEKGTSVLNIAYRDTDKELVLPVIKRVSQTYQTYSGRDRSRDLTQGVSYLEEQLNKLRPQANKSMRAAQAFALNNGLGLQDGMPVAVSAGSRSVSAGSGSVESSRETAQNKVNALQQQLTAARAAGASQVYLAPQLEANADLYAKLQGLEAKLREKSVLLRANDQSIQTLQRQILSLTKVINHQTIGLLEGQLQTARAKLISLTRPRPVVLKHRELVRTALRDEKTVTELEAKLQTLRLEKARQTDPWELISTPTLLDKPVAPRRGRIMALGLLAGLVMGSGAALVVDRRTGLVFSLDELQALLPCPLLKHLPALSTASWGDAASLLASGPLASASGNGPVALVPVGDVPVDQLQAFASELSRALGGRELLVSSDLRQTSGCVTQLMITAPGVATRTQLNQLGQTLALQGTPLAGWVFLDPGLSG